MQGRSAPGFSVSTRCETIGEFITTFWDRSDERSIVVNVAEPRAVGTECAFAILLVNKKPVLAGTCVVLDVYTTTNNPFKRVGMRLGIQKMGPESERVFAELASTRAARTKRKGTQLGMPVIPRTTMALPIVNVDVALEASAVPAAIAVPRTTQPMRSLTRARLQSVQIPAKVEPFTAAVRGTPMPTLTPKPAITVVPTITPEPAITPVPTIAKPRAPAPIETRTPGSSYVLPANPLSGVPDVSLDGFVERELDAAMEPSVEELPAPAPLRLARGTLDEPDDSAEDDEPTKPSETTFDTATAEPLPPPPVTASIAAAVVEAPIIEAPPVIEQTQPRRRRGRWLAVAATTVVLAAGVAMYVRMPMKSTPAASPEVEPTLALTSVVASDISVEGTEQTEAAPPAPIEVAQPIHAVLIRTYPGSARVVVGDQSFGTTPTYVKIPANTPVDIQITRPGFKPVTRTVTSTRRFDQVFVQLQPTTMRRVIRPRPARVPVQPAAVDLSNL